MKCVVAAGGRFHDGDDAVDTFIGAFHVSSGFSARRPSLNEVTTPVFEFKGIL